MRTVLEIAPNGTPGRHGARRRVALLAAVFALPMIAIPLAASAQQPASPSAAEAAIPLAPVRANPGAVASAPSAPHAATSKSGSAVSLASLVDRDRTVVNGNVAEVFGNRFVIDDGTARRLVEAGPDGYAGAGVSVGDTVTVEGRFADAIVAARTIAINGGETIDLPEPAPQGDAFPPPPGPRGRPHAMKRHGPGHPHGPGRGPDAGPRPHDGPPSAGFFGWFENVVDADAGKLELEKSGYTDVTLQEERRHDADFTATGPDGKLWLVKVDAADAIVEREPYQPLPDEAAAKAAIEKLGLKWTGGFTERKHHVEADAATADGKSLVVELNPDGSLRKERF